MFRGCSVSGAASPGSSADWTTFQKKLPTLNTAFGSTIFAVSFQPAGKTVQLPSGMLADTGGQFQKRGNFAYGWKCDGKPWKRSGPFKSSGSLNENTTNAFLLERLSGCAGKSSGPQWELAIPNGVYRVTARPEQNPRPALCGAHS